MSDQSETAKTPADRTLEADNLILHSLDELHRVHFRFKKLPHNTGVKVLEVMRVSMLRGVRLPQASEDPNAYFTALVLGLTPAAYLEIRETLYSFAAYRKDEDTAWVDLGGKENEAFEHLTPYDDYRLVIQGMGCNFLASSRARAAFLVPAMETFLSMFKAN